MPITTEPFVLPPSDHLDILFRRMLDRSIPWVGALAAAGTALSLTTKRRWWLGAALNVAAIGLGVRALLAWNSVYSDANDQVLRWRHLEIEDDRVTTIFEEGGAVTTRLESGAQVIRRPEYVLIQIGDEALYVPFRAIKSDDRGAFEQWVAAREG